MTAEMFIAVPEPKFRVGAVVLALVNHKPRYARLEKAYLNAHLILDSEGLSFENKPRWEYAALVFNDPIEQSETVIITEKTIFYEVQGHSSERNDGA
jgi:hypothetical protein